MKDFNRNQQIRNKVRNIMQIRSEKKIKEKDSIKKDVKVLRHLADDFDPELYIKEQEESEKDDNMSDN